MYVLIRQSWYLLVHALLTQLLQALFPNGSNVQHKGQRVLLNFSFHLHIELLFVPLYHSVLSTLSGAYDAYVVPIHVYLVVIGPEY